MKVLIIADGLDGLKLKSDTSLYFARSALNSGDEVFWAQPSELSWKGTEIFSSGLKLQNFKRGERPTTQKFDSLHLKDFSALIIRKDPPFNTDYMHFCWLLMPFEKKIRMINRPQALVRYHEKMLPFEMLHQGYISESDLIPQWVLKSKVEVKNVLNEFSDEEFILKPWLGYGGNQIQKFSKSEVLQSAERFEREDLILQVFDREVLSQGDRRVLFWAGKYIGDFVRMPAKGSFVSNLAQGGSAVHRDLSKAEQKLIWKIEKFLSAERIDFAGADLIGTRLNELNITSPTGLGSVEDLSSKDLAVDIYKDLKLHL